MFFGVSQGLFSVRVGSDCGLFTCRISLSNTVWMDLMVTPISFHNFNILIYLDHTSNIQNNTKGLWYNLLIEVKKWNRVLPLLYYPSCMGNLCRFLNCEHRILCWHYALLQAKTTPTGALPVTGAVSLSWRACGWHRGATCFPKKSTNQHKGNVPHPEKTHVMWS